MEDNCFTVLYLFLPYNTNQQLPGSLEDIQYALGFEHALRSLESQLHNTDNPEVIALEMLVAAVEFYDGDWCGVVEADLEVGAWTPLWWYDRRTGGMTLGRGLDLRSGCSVAAGTV